MVVKVSALILLFSTLCVFAQTASRKSTAAAPPPASTPTPSLADDELKRHLGAAETYQLTGDMSRAAVENQAVVAIALQRVGLLAIEQGNYDKAVKYLNDSAGISDSSATRTSLAVAYASLAQNDQAVTEAQKAVDLDPKNVRAYLILGNLYYSKGDYQNALPILEKIIKIAPDFDGAYLLGMTYLNLKQLERAKLLFEEIQNAVQKNNASLHMLFGRAFEQTEYPLEAEREYKQAIAINSKEPKAYFHLGFVILQNGGGERLAEAGKAFEQELLTSPQDFYSNFFLGVVNSSLNEHQKAVQYLQKAISLNPNMRRAYLFLGQSQVELGDTVNAEKNLRRAIALSTDSVEDPQIQRAHFLLGRLLIKEGKKEEADKELAKARQLQGQQYDRDRDVVNKILGEVSETEKKETSPMKSGSVFSTDPKNRPALTPQQTAEYAKIKKQLTDILGQAYNNLGVIDVQQGNWTDSLAKFSAAAEWEPDLPGLDRNQGIVNFRTNQFDKAIPFLSRQTKADPKDNLARRLLGVCYYFTKDYKQAVATLKPVELQLTDDVELTYFYGLSLLQLQMTKDAEALFLRLIQQNPQNAQAHFYGAQGFVFLGNFEKALQEFRATSSLAPQLAQAHYNAGQSLIRLNRLDEAEKEFRQELQLNPSNELSKYHLAFTLLERKIQLDEAVRLLNEVLLTKPDYADANYQLGKYYVEKGQIEKATGYLESAARTEPKKDYIHYQLSIAYRKASRTADADRELKIYSDLKAANRETGSSTMGN